MFMDQEKTDTVRFSVEVAKRKLKEIELMTQGREPTRAESFEMDMIKDVIKRGEAILLGEEHG